MILPHDTLLTAAFPPSSPLQDAASVYNLRGLLAQRENKATKALAYLSRAIKQAPAEAR